MEPWRVLLVKALRQLAAAGLTKDLWTLGGGTAMMFTFRHRLSKDIDIFLPDRQYLGYLSPRLNDGVEADLNDYIEQERFVRLYFDEGEVDFIAAPRLTMFKPTLKTVGGHEIFVDHPVEIVTKKIIHRADEFKTRDLFDLALVYSRCPSELLETATVLAPQLETLAARLDLLESTGQLGKNLSAIAAIDGGQDIRGRELSLVRECLTWLVGHRTKTESAMKN
ncbi:MAG: nucleotidyl transferase AbiEii/AbiGii toxin family protein [Candidatus Adiutrix sp.]|jgi:hypothetical protein|nr:nucleotidyl transferase AbiEii/AbiGii toxin family protein [Candidatus Adiutrix sp.]